MATAKSSIPAHVKRDILSEAGAADCEVVDLLAGCYGSYAYMEESYGITMKRCERVMRDVNELPEFIKQEHGIEITAYDVVDTMRDAWAKVEAFWDDQF